jgi:predicted flap endonuclease-1-like 5' DNA nuclease
MTKKDKLGIDKIISRLNKEFEKTSTQIEKLVKDAMKQIENIQSQIQEPVKKLKDDIEKVRERELKRFHSEFDKKIEEFNKLQNSILEKLGIHSNTSPTSHSAKIIKPTTNQPEKTSAKKTAPKKSSTAKKKTPMSKAVASTATKKVKVNETTLTHLKGVGPALKKKLNESGITSLKQIAAPSTNDAKILEKFSTVKGFDTWKETAQKLTN